MSAAPTKRVSLLAAIRAAPIAAPFPTLEELKEMLGIPDSDHAQDAEITNGMAATVAMIERYLGRGIAEADELQPFAPIDARNPKLMLYRFPVSVVRGVTVDDAPISGWRLIARAGILEWHDGGCGAMPRAGCEADPIVEVDYTGGYPDDAWPPDLLDAVLRAFCARWNATGATGNVADLAAAGPVKSVTVDGLGVTYGDLSTNLSDMGAGPIPPELVGVAAMLDPYRQRLVTGV